MSYFLVGRVEGMRMKRKAAMLETQEKLDASGKEESPPTKFWHWLGSDYIQIDSGKAEEKLRRVSQGMLFPGEKVEMAFKLGRSKVYFTDARVILRPKSRLGYSATYTSVPYESLKAYQFETAGMWPNMDTHIKLYTNLPGMRTISLGFRKGTRPEKVDVYEVAAYFAKKLLGLNVKDTKGEDALLETSQNSTVQRWGLWDSLAWLGGDNTQLDAGWVEESLRAKATLLGDDEKVLMAFKVGRDTTLLTSRRLIKIDVTGISGRTINYLTLPYETMKAFQVRTAGHFDLDSEVRIWTDIPGYTSFQYDLRAGKADPKGVNALLSDKILGVENPNAASLAQTNATKKIVFDIFHWLDNNFQQVSASDAEYAMRQQDILQAEGEEHVLMAFRVGRDCNMLTNKRVLLVDVQAMSGKKVQYRSIPYHGIQSWGVTTAGRFDSDAELEFWTAVTPPSPIPMRCPTEEDPHPPPGRCPPPAQCPTVSWGDTCMSYFKFDLADGRADLWRIQQVLSAKVLGFEDRPNRDWNASELTVTVDKRHGGGGHDGPIGVLYDWMHKFDGNAHQVDVNETERKLKYGGILHQDEGVKLAFRLRKDFHIWTTKRFLLVDRKRFWFGKKVLYRSTPYVSVKAFSWTSAGMFDLDSELEFWTAMPWLPHYKQDLAGGRINAQEVMQEIGREISTYKIHPALPRSLWPQSAFSHSAEEGESLLDKGSPVGDFVGWFKGAGYKLDANELNKEFHTETPFLLPDEEVKFAVKASRDTTLVTNKRTMFVDVKGITGTSVQYMTIPFGAVGAFSVESAGLMDVDTNMKIFTTAYGLTKFQQNFRKGEVDIFYVSDLLTNGTYHGMIAA